MANTYVPEASFTATIAVDNGKLGFGTFNTAVDRDYAFFGNWYGTPNSSHPYLTATSFKPTETKFSFFNFLDDNGVSTYKIGYITPKNITEYLAVRLDSYVVSVPFIQRCLGWKVQLSADGHTLKSSDLVKGSTINVYLVSPNNKKLQVYWDSTWQKGAEAKDKNWWKFISDADGEERTFAIQILETPIPE